MDDYKKIPFDDPDLCVPDLDDFDQRNIIPLTAPCISRSRTVGEIGSRKIGINRATSLSDMTTTTAIRSKTIEKEN